MGTPFGREIGRVELRCEPPGDSGLGGTGKPVVVVEGGVTDRVSPAGVDIVRDRAWPLSAPLGLLVTPFGALVCKCAVGTTVSSSSLLDFRLCIPDILSSVL